MAARRWSWLVVLIGGLGLFEALRRALIDTANPNLVPALILLGAAVIPAAFTAFIAGRRLDYGVTGGTVALTALVGGVIGVVVAGLLEYHALRRLGTVPMIGVGIFEEGAKLLVPIVVLVFTRHRRLADGLLIGVASGAGFAALETMGYAFVTLVQSNGNLSAMDGVLILRGVLSPAAHMAWTGLTAAALWRATTAPSGRPTRLHLGRFAVIFAVAVALHATWDSLHTLTGYTVLAIVSLGLLAVTTHRLAIGQQRVPTAQPSGPGTPPLLGSAPGRPRGWLNRTD
jgi:RsiW-degrading membrane proteinase PrsW (M82 family)